MALFEVDQLSNVDPRNNTLPRISNPHSKQLLFLITHLRQTRPRFMQLNLVRQGMDPTVELRFNNLMIEDANLDNVSYVDFLINAHRNIQTNLSSK
jgi:protein transport protein SEC24